MDIKQNIENINQEIINIRRDFHRNPELSDNEFGTMEKNLRLFRILGGN